MPLTCSKCNIDSPRDDYEYCLNCGTHLLEISTVVIPKVRRVPIAESSHEVSQQRSALRANVLFATVGVLGFLGAVIVLLYTTGISHKNVDIAADGQASNTAANASSTPNQIQPDNVNTDRSESLRVPTDRVPIPENLENPTVSNQAYRGNESDVNPPVTPTESRSSSNVASNSIPRNAGIPNSNTMGNRNPRLSTPAPPPNAIALCMDGSFAFVVSSTACAHRGGAATWYVSGIDDGRRPRAICRDGHISYWQYDRMFTCGGGGVRFWYY